VVRTYASAGGHDTADVYDSAGDDVFYANPTVAWIQGNGYVNGYAGFGTMRAYATGGGYDRAYLYDSSGNDQLNAQDNWAELTAADYRTMVVDFSWVEAVSSRGGRDTKDVEAIDYVLQTTGPWLAV